MYSKSLQGVLKKLDANYKSFFGLRKNGDFTARPPNFRSKNFFQTIVYNQSGFKITNERISFSHNVSDIPLDFRIDKVFPNIKQLEIYNDNPYHGKGDFYVSITYEVAVPEYVDKMSKPI